ncbi:hypothetical protein [Tenacibaculum ovolyticum]|uniref:hypothetical protein n=1 Tax=Tenacibaculum ovolyticum TaxID=104270 RepID=UPI0007EC7D51|nr:hypothetical protein [Tenacibaculum ovolyticum]
MRIKSIILIAFFIACGCKKEQKENIKDSIPEESIRNVANESSVITKEKVEEIVIYKSIPIPELIEFVKKIEKSDLIPDTLRLRKKRLYEYLGEKKIFSNYPFYKILYESTDLKRANELWPELLNKQSTKLNIKLFKRAKSIWGYFYKDKNGGDTISDGVIEQWEFENEEEVKEALEQIELAGHFVYFNTRPFHCRVKNYLITFRTRAMGFSYDQKKIFEEFISKIDDETN